MVFARRGPNLVVVQPEHHELWEVLKHPQIPYTVVVQDELLEYFEATVAEAVTFPDKGVRDFQSRDLPEVSVTEVFLEPLVGDPASVLVSGLELLGAVDRDAVEDLELLEIEDGVQMVPIFLGE